MRRRIVSFIYCTLTAIGVVNAQNGFTHGPGDGIEAVYFDTSLAPFYHGLASGDPLDDRVIIWTRVTPEYDTTIRVQWKMALDTGFTKVVKEGVVNTDYTKDYTVKVDVDGLQPGVTYYYYFSALKRNSIIGRTHTLPQSTVDHLRFAVVSCVNYQMGYFNGYKRIAERNDLDAVLHLGDYIYEYPTYGYGYTAEVGRTHRPNHTIITLDDYRIRHSFYKLDQDLRAAHQQHPFIAVWDDHEIVNNTYETGAMSHDPKTEGDFETRKQNAIRAYLEWMPIRHPEFVRNARIYRKFSYGNLAQLLMLDTRDEARNAQVTNVNSPQFSDPNRRILGDVQRNWMLDNMKQSKATWQILGNQVMFSQDGITPDIDAWTGYPAERKLVLDELTNMSSRNNIILTGDTHRSWAYDLTEAPHDTARYEPFTGKGTFGVELATPSLASPNRNESSPGTSPVPQQQALLVENPHLRYVDLDNHGYFILDITPAKAQADYFYVDTKMRSANETFASGWFTNVGDGYLQKATSLATGKLQATVAAPGGAAPFKVTEPGTGIMQAPTLLVSGIYPNPAHDYIYIGLALNEASDLSLTLTDVSGHTIQSHNFPLNSGNHTIKIQTGNAVPGIYILVIKDNNGYTQRRKILVQ